MQSEKIENGKQLYAQLQNMSATTYRDHYDRVKVARRLLERVDWVEDPTGGGGSLDRAIRRLDQDVFADLCGLITTAELLAILEAYPSKEQWVAYKGNFRKMLAELRSKENGQRNGKVATKKPSANGIVLRTPMEFQQLPDGQKRKEFERVYNLASNEQREIARLKDRLAKVEAERDQYKAEVATLRDRLRNLQRMAQGVA